MGRGKSANRRVSIAVSDEIRTEAPRHAELLGLPEDAPRSKLYERLLERGWQAARQEERDRAQLDLYAAYARDPERQAVARADQQELLRSRVF